MTGDSHLEPDVKACATGLPARLGLLSLLNSIRLPVGRCYQLAYYHQTCYSHAMEVLFSYLQIDAHDCSVRVCVQVQVQVFCLAQVTVRNVRVQSTLKLHLYIRAHLYAHMQVHVHGVAQVKSDTWCET